MEEYTHAQLEERADEILKRCCENEISDGSLLDALYEINSWDDLDEFDKYYCINYLLGKTRRLTVTPVNITFVKFDDSHQSILKDGRKVGELNKQSYGRKLWNIEIDGKRIVDGGADCFSLAIAKQIVKRKLKKP